MRNRFFFFNIALLLDKGLCVVLKLSIIVLIVFVMRFIKALLFNKLVLDAAFLLD